MDSTISLPPPTHTQSVFVNPKKKWFFKEIHTVCKDDVTVSEISAGSNVGDFGWIESDSYPSNTNGSTSCQWIVNIPRGLSVQIGFEEFFFVENEEQDILEKRPRLDDDKEGEEEENDENIFDEFGTFRESRKVKSKAKVDQNVPSMILTDTISSSSLFRAPLSSVEGATYRTKSESSVSFKIEIAAPELSIQRFRFRINFLVISPAWFDAGIIFREL